MRRFAPVLLLALVVAPTAASRPSEPCPSATVHGSDWYTLVKRYSRLTAVFAQYSGDDTAYESFVCVRSTGRRIALDGQFDIDWPEGRAQPRDIQPLTVASAGRYLAYRSTYCEQDTEEYCDETVSRVDAGAGLAREVSPNYNASHRSRVVRVVVLPNGAVAWSLRTAIVACGHACRRPRCQRLVPCVSVIARGANIEPRSLTAGRDVVAWMQGGKRRRVRLR